MISGENILCFGSEKWEYPGFQQTIMRKLSSSNKILFVSPIGTRMPKFQWLQFKTIFDRLINIFIKPKSQIDNSIICMPWVIPLVYSALIMKINRKLINYQIKRLMRKHSFKPTILWIGTPSAAFLIDLFDVNLIVYHAVDRYSKFSFVNADKIRKYEEIISKKANLILCTSDMIKDDLNKYNNEVYTVTHAVDFNHFNSAMESSEVPEDIKGIPKPIIGYFGGLSERVNFNLLIKITEQFPRTSIVLIGSQLTDLKKIKKYPNIHLIGYKPIDILPFYLNQFSVCLIPYYVNELMKGVDPIKLREYLCLGKPVVSVNLPEVKKHENLVYIGLDTNDFLAKVDKALNEKNSSMKENRIRLAKLCDWKIKIDEISLLVNSALAKRNRNIIQYSIYN